MNQEQRAILEQISTINVSDALESFGLKGATYGILPVWEGCKKIVGEAVTVRLIPAGLTPSKTHFGINAIESAQAGDIIVVDNAGKLDISCWGGALATVASQKGNFRGSY